jgi:D-alanyl-D-alanine carboxypeptidase/D-alanyl-D-alanine-endopeptidase (penicillin-binding protein 4)
MVKSIRKRITTQVKALSVASLLIMTAGCGIQKAQKTLLASPSLKGAHLGIAIYNDTKSQWVSKHQSDHYFTPASNTKILATYLGLKFLGDSLPGWSVSENTDTLFLRPLGDPSFLHPDFAYQPVIDLIKETKKQVIVRATNAQDNFEPFGNGWAWNDYAEDYQPERSRMPIYGNVVHFYQAKGGLSAIKPLYFFKDYVDLGTVYQKNWTRSKASNNFHATNEKNTAAYFQVPFSLYNEPFLPVSLLKDTLQRIIPFTAVNTGHSIAEKIIKTVPTDSLLKIMMRRSDNFFADQVLLMASEQLLGKMDDAALIDTVMKTDFSNLPQKMRWADGSGLSRYNLNTPENYVAILKSMQDQFGQARVTNIFETGGEGTLSAYFKNFPGELHAKTGSLGGQIALSGFIFTLKKQKLYFSVLVSNHMSPTSAGVRRAVETYLREVAKRN